MNVKVLLVLLLVFMLVVPDADAWAFGRRRRRWRFRVRKLICKLSCGTVCSTTGAGVVVCSLGCHKVCGRKKRDVSSYLSYDEEDPAAAKAHPYAILFPLPYKMSMYDEDKDRRISIAELRAVLPKGTKKKSIKTAFKAMDRNGDKYIDCQEFRQLVLERKPQC